MQIEYFLVLFLSVIGPAVLSRSNEIRFYDPPGRLIAAIGIPLPVFVIWDIIATARGHWDFNPAYVTGLYIFNLPVEEVLFFVVVPFCALFTWESVKYFMRKKP